jgi:hypothetical protein
MSRAACPVKCGAYVTRVRGEHHVAFFFCKISITNVMYVSFILLVPGMSIYLLEVYI